MIVTVSQALFVMENVSVYCEVGTEICGPGSLVGIATDYGVEGPGSNPGGDEIFRPSRPALGPTLGRAVDHSPPSSAVVIDE